VTGKRRAERTTSVLQEYGTHDEPLKGFVLRPEPI